MMSARYNNVSYNALWYVVKHLFYGSFFFIYYVMLLYIVNTAINQLLSMHIRILTGRSTYGKLTIRSTISKLREVI